MANFSWSTDLDGVDISQQSVRIVGEVVLSELTLSNVDSSYCGVYYCSASDRYSTGIPPTVNATVSVNIGKCIWRLFYYLKV